MKWNPSTSIIQFAKQHRPDVSFLFHSAFPPRFFPFLSSTSQTLPVSPANRLAWWSTNIYDGPCTTVTNREIKCTQKLHKNVHRSCTKMCTEVAEMCRSCTKMCTEVAQQYAQKLHKNVHRSCTSNIIIIINLTLWRTLQNVIQTQKCVPNQKNQLWTSVFSKKAA